MGTEYTTTEIQAKYDEFADKYASSERVQKLFGMGRLRRRLLQRASGAVLEVACGTGANFPYYPSGCEITAVDVSSVMLSLADRRAEDQAVEIDIGLMDAHALAFPNAYFDTVISSLTLCTFPDPIAALEEMRRVCRSDGRILLLEHGRSSNRLLGRLQDIRADAHAEQLGCRWNREPLELVERAGLHPVTARRTFFGVFHEIEALPHE